MLARVRPVGVTRFHLQPQPMKRLHCLVLLVLSLSIGRVLAQTPIVPKGWIKPERLEGALAPMQRQLDSGIAMLETAWCMADVADAELFVIYISLYEKLPAKERDALFKEQEKWLRDREKTAVGADDGKSGQIGHLQSAAEHRDTTEARIAELKARLPKKKK